jgi:predicted HTH domain antitoxin
MDSASRASEVPKTSRVVLDYFDGEISLGKAAELLGISRFELRERFQRLHIPLRLGPSTLAEAKAEVEAARLAR